MGFHAASTEFNHIQGFEQWVRRNLNPSDTISDTLSSPTFSGEATHIVVDPHIIGLRTSP
jgi:hypothetical protein